MKAVLVTGSGRGLGKGFVTYLLDEGWKVFGGMRHISMADPDLTTNPHFVPVTLDVTDNASINAAFKIVAEQTKYLDLLVNNAGLNKDSATNNNKDLVCKLGDLDRQSLLKMFDVNSISPMIVLQKFLPLLKETPSFVINISSCRASYHDEFGSTNGNYGYRASKTALNMMTFCSVMDLPNNIKIFAVHPGSVMTDMNPEGTDLPYDQAKKIMDITTNWKEEFNGRYLRYDGSLYPL